jgi:hypothetical protein
MINFAIYFSTFRRSAFIADRRNRHGRIAPPETQPKLNWPLSEAAAARWDNEGVYVRATILNNSQLTKAGHMPVAQYGRRKRLTWVPTSRF